MTDAESGAKYTSRASYIYSEEKRKTVKITLQSRPKNLVTFVREAFVKSANKY